jgi:hypothetical protein
LIVLPCPSHHLQKMLLWLWLHIALHKVAEELLYPGWRWFFEEFAILCDGYQRRANSSVMSGDILILSTWDEELSKWLSPNAIGTHIMQPIITCRLQICFRRLCPKLPEWEMSNAFKVEYFQEGVQDLMHVSSPTTKFYMPSYNNSLVIMFKQKAKRKVLHICHLILHSTIKELNKSLIIKNQWMHYYVLCIF